ncbi:MAG TPA: LysM peptidoglycan-binding domain-containing protein [Bacillus sp. (in: firmicutes)]|nr:LysM peptidoglycan-binding domain-containing protein [Bacillus sp. (in: firmicutes)]
MKKTNMKKWTFVSAVTLSFLAGQGTAEAATPHKVVKGDTLWALSKGHGVTVDELKKVNHRQNDVIYIGETLTIPDHTGVQANSPATHKVVKGDTLWKLGKEHGVTVNELKKVNHRQNDMIYIGETLTIPVHTGAQASSPAIHKVATGDTLFSIAKQYGVTVEGLKAANQLQNDTIYIGQTLTIGSGTSSDNSVNSVNSAISAEDKDLLSRLVEAEAKGEPYQGKVAVATVVLNRVASPEFPDSIHDVIYQQLENGGYQFTPVGNGAINQPASDESKRAVDEALASQNQANDALYFYNPEIATNDWVKTQQVTAVIGNHVFAK